MRRIVHLETGKRKLVCGKPMTKRTLTTLYPQGFPVKIFGGTLEICATCAKKAK